MAPPTKLTDEVEAVLTEVIRRGGSYRMACQRARITYQTFRNWMLAGERASRGRKHDFFLAVEAAVAVDGLENVEFINAARSEHWQAAAWKLERRYPQDYGRTVTEHTGEEGGPLRIVIEHVDAAERPD